MNKNSEKIAIGSFLALLITLIILALIMTAEHFQWIETNVLGEKTKNTTEQIEYNIEFIIDSSGVEPPKFVFTTNNTGIFEYENEFKGITVTTKDGEVYTFFEQEDGSWVRR